MTLQETKNIIAVGYGMKDWDDLQHDMIVDERVIELLEIYDIAVDKYAEAKAKEAWNAAIDAAAEGAKMQFHDGHHKENKEISHFQSGADNLTVSKQPIPALTNATLATLCAISFPVVSFTKKPYAF